MRTITMKSSAACLAALGALSLAACEQSASSDNSTATPTPAPMTAPSTPTVATPQSPAGGPRVVVDNETGVQITPAAGGQTITVAFGAQRAQARATLVAALGQPSEYENPDCPWGPATLWLWPSGQAVVVNNELVGWSGDEGDFGYTCIAD